VKLTNLDFDIDRSELVRLAEDFGEIEHIELPMKENGLNTGIAKIYFKNKKSS
jgi:RNA recognition motif-containing protein